MRNIVNERAFMLSFSTGFLLAYEKGTDFPKLISYPVTRLKIFISTSFLVDLWSLKSSHYLQMEIN